MVIILILLCVVVVGWVIYLSWMLVNSKKNEKGGKVFKDSNSLIEVDDDTIIFNRKKSPKVKFMSFDDDEVHLFMDREESQVVDSDSSPYDLLENIVKEYRSLSPNRRKIFLSQMGIKEAEERSDNEIMSGMEDSLKVLFKEKEFIRQINEGEYSKGGKDSVEGESEQRKEAKREEGAETERNTREKDAGQEERLSKAATTEKREREDLFVGYRERLDEWERPQGTVVASLNECLQYLEDVSPGTSDAIIKYLGYNFNVPCEHHFDDIYAQHEYQKEFEETFKNLEGMSKEEANSYILTTYRRFQSIVGDGLKDTGDDKEPPVDFSDGFTERTPEEMEEGTPVTVQGFVDSK